MKKINELVIFDQFRLKPKKDPYEPKKYKYKKSKNGILVKINKYGIPIKDKDAKSLMFKAKSYLRDRAINETSHVIRSMKTKAYNFDKTELEKLIKQQEKKILEKEGWGLIKKAAIIHFGFIPFV
jgi:hypothetical protein